MKQKYSEDGNEIRTCKARRTLVIIDNKHTRKDFAAEMWGLAATVAAIRGLLDHHSNIVAGASYV
jgi:hypothetical protein